MPDPPSKRKKVTNAGMDLKKKEPFWTAGGTIKCTAIMENSAEFPPKKRIFF